jgi:NADH-quinone oxidoreductase subunit M
MLYERRHSYEIDDFGGLAASVPVFAAMLVFAGMASVGLPTTAGFVSEFLVLLGTFQQHPWFALIAGTGVIFAAYYMLPMVQKVVFNPLSKPANRSIPDLNGRELAILLPLVALILWMGIYPKPVLDRMAPAAHDVVARAQASRFVRDLPPAAVPPAGQGQPGGVAMNGGR